ncbi:MAG: hypothetical protein ACON4C_01500 [Henriciella sp.]|jgi:hypothetical protein
MNFVLVLLILLVGGLVWSRVLAGRRQPELEALPPLRPSGELLRSLELRRSLNQGALSDVADPREAAALLMALIAAASGAVTSRQRDVMQAEAEHVFGFSPVSAGGLIEHAVWLGGKVDNPHAAVVRMTDLVQTTLGLGQKEIVDLDGMLVAVSEAEGSPLAPQLELLALFRQKAGLKV